MVKNKKEEKVQAEKDKIVKNKKENKYNLAEVVVIMVITSICSILITIKVCYISNDTSKSIKNTADLSEFIKTYNSITTEFYKDVDKGKLINSAIEGMINYLGDPYSIYLNEKETANFNLELDGEYVGMGAEITLKDNNVVITKIYKSSPAEKAGLKLNDIIVRVGTVEGKTITLDEIANKIKGKANTKVKLVIKRDDKDVDVEITRGKVELPSVTSKILESNSKKIGVITVSLFANNTYVQFNEQIKLLNKEKINGLIVDVRNNTGGYLTTAKSIADMFLDKNDVICQLETKGKTEKLYAKSKKEINIPTVILVNGASASASEIFTAALNENNKSEVVGTKTYGKSKVQKAEELSSGAMIKYTIQSWLTPKGNKIDEVGIKPTVEVELNKDYYSNPTDENDNQLQKALEIISK